LSKVSESIGEQTRQYFIDRLDAGYKVDDKTSMLDLVKDAMEKLNLKHGSSGRTKAILNKVLIEKGVITVGKGFEKKADGIEIVLEGKKPDLPTVPEPEQKQGFLGVQPESAQAPQTQQTQQTQTKPPLPPLSDADLPKYQRKLGRVSNFVTKMYVKFGILTEEEKKNLEQDYKDVSDDVASYCVENNTRLPKQLDLMLLGVQIGVLFVVPILKWLFKSKKKDEKKKEEK
jgi:hypothetical protein